MRLHHTKAFAIAFTLIFISGCVSTSSSKPSPFLLAYEQAESDYRVGLLTEAEASYRRAIELRPSFYEPWLKLGNIYVRTGRLDSAVRMYEKCTLLKPDDVRGWKNLSLVRLKQSLSVLNEASQYFPENTRGYAIIGEARDSLVQYLID